MKRIWGLGLIAAIALFGEARAARTVVTLAGVPERGQTIETVQGRPALSSTGTSSGVALILSTPAFVQDATPVFILAVKNVSAADVAIGTDHISINTDAGPAAILTAEAMKAIARRAVQGAQGLTGGVTGVTGAQRGGSYINQEPAQNLRERQALAAQTYVGAADRAERGAGRTAESIGFRPFKVGPGETAFMPMAIAHVPDRATQLEIRVVVDQEVHLFSYDVTRKRK